MRLPTGRTIEATDGLPMARRQHWPARSILAAKMEHRWCIALRRRHKRIRGSRNAAMARMGQTSRRLSC